MAGKEKMAIIVGKMNLLNHFNKFEKGPEPVAKEKVAGPNPVTRFVLSE